MCICFQDGSEKSRTKSPEGAVAAFCRFMRQLIGQADGFMTCIALLVAGLAVSYTGICRERQKRAESVPSQADTVPAVKKKAS